MQPGQDSGHAVSGGFVYRGRQVPQLQGKYVFGDIVNGRVFYTNEGEMRRNRKPAPIYEAALLDHWGKRLTMQELAGDKRLTCISAPTLSVSCTCCQRPTARSGRSLARVESPLNIVGPVNPIALR